MERIWTITHRVLAVGFNENVLGNTWWALDGQGLGPKHEQALLLWLNCSLSILSFYGRRVITRSAWMQMKKPAWHNMPVLDVKSLSDEQLDDLSNAYDKLASQELQAIAMLSSDPVRAAIDEAICSALKLPDLKLIREYLSREPGLTGKSLNRGIPKTQTALELEEEESDQASLI
ncbi:MAG TPA: hypothetical protein PLU95_08685 [Syntrophales bacterium]|nr:hypothetical protein [Syntrophorhabdaceae bacterium]HPN09365.1 hypothetical protein [Syntrophales bacterium]HPX81886.1 hypothetical protein [Syntrophales bacterium]